MSINRKMAQNPVGPFSGPFRKSSYQGTVFFSDPICYWSIVCAIEAACKRGAHHLLRKFTIGFAAWMAAAIRRIPKQPFAAVMADKEKTMGRTWTCVWVFIIGILLAAPTEAAGDVHISEATAECLDCHASIHPGIVKDWRNGRHATHTPRQGLSADKLSRRVSSDTIPEGLLNVVIGCAECHTLHPDKHADTVEHNGYPMHVVVTPRDCATCHSQESGQYAENIMSHAVQNLAGNDVYQQLETSIIGESRISNSRIDYGPPDAMTRADACYYCHGTRLKVVGKQVRDTEAAGELEFAVIEGWPNQGVGRVNPDGSRGSCSACHTRHAFSIEMARKPYTCKECHVGPDVPAFPVYSASKHGNLFSAMGKDWNFRAIPWTLGEDIGAPTCATCHMSLLDNPDGEVIAQRTHQMGNRLAWRIYGLIYAHPHPLKPDTTIIRNRAGLALPTDLDGSFASRFLIDDHEMQKRTAGMQAICLGCHSGSWVKGHWKKFENTIARTNGEILTATRIMRDVWKDGLASGLAHNSNPFDEFIEKKWHMTWLFYANSIRFTAAMAGGGDYGVFAGGRYQLSLSIAEMSDWYRERKKPRAGE